MNKQVFLSLALVVLASFSSVNVFAEGIEAGAEINVSVKKDSSRVRAALNSLQEFCVANKYYIAGGALTAAGLYILAKVMYKNNILGFRDFVDGTTTEAERLPELRPWNSIN